jgi:hypothetical protein
MAPRVWFMLGESTKPSGGTNHIYRLCEIAEELGIYARVIGPKPYEFPDPPHLAKYWMYAQDSFKVNEGDVVVGPELWPTKSMFNVPVRRVIYIQNWSVSHQAQPWERVFLYYGGVHHNYAIGRVGAEAHPLDYLIAPHHELQISQAAPTITRDKVEWFRVQPYFDFNQFNPYSKDRNRSKAMAMPRRCPNQTHSLLGRGVNIDMIEGVEPSIAKSLYSKYGVFVLMTPAEGLCFPAIEALASGTAVVSWPSGAPEEFLIDKETARMAKYGSVDEVIELTKELLADHQQQIVLAERGRDLVSKIFTREQTAAQLFIAYHAILRHEPQI